MADILLIDIKSGGTPPAPEPQPQNGYRVRYFDGVNAEPIKTQYLETGDATPPNNPNPDPDYLIFDGWNNPSMNIESDRDIGAMYTTVDDATWAFLDVNHKTGKGVYFYFLCNDGKITLDFGDGSAPIIASVESANKVKAFHDYSDYGKYVVKITCSGSQGYTLGYGDMINMFIGDINPNTSSSSADMQTLEKLYCASDVQIQIFALYYNLRVLILPNSITSIGDYSISYLTPLTSLVLPNSLTSIGSDSISALTSLTSLVLSNSLTSIGSGSISYLYSLTSLVLSNSLTSIGDYSIFTLYSLTSLVLPSNLTSIGSGSLNALFGNLIVESETPPTLQAPLSIEQIVGFLGIYVPDDSVNTYKNATNWSLVADFIFPLSDLDNYGNN